MLTVPSQTQPWNGRSQLLIWSIVSSVFSMVPSVVAEPTARLPAPNSLMAERQTLPGPIIPVWQLEERPTSTQDKRLDQSGSETSSPTPSLSGEAIFSLIQAGGDRPGSEESLRPSLGSRIRLNIETSFTGEDRLRLRLQTTNVTELDDVFGTDLARLSIQGDDQFQVSLSRLDYQFPLGEDTAIFVQAIGGSISDIADPLNPRFSSSSRGAISRFGQRNPLYRQGGSAGIGLSHDFSDRINLSLGYLGDDQDLFSDEETVAFAQLTLEPAESIKVSFLYTYGLNGLGTGTGSQQANDPFADQSEAISAHSLGLQATGEITEQLTLSGWAGYTRATATDLPNRPQADIFNWALTLGYSDLWLDRALGGLIMGRPPDVVSNANPTSPAWHLEVFYQIPVSDRITLTPGIMIITNPESEPNRSPIVVGTLRTLFRF